MRYRKPMTTRVQQALDFFEGSFTALEDTMRSSLPEGRERALAMTKLEEAFQWVTQSVLTNQEHYSPDLKDSHEEGKS